MSISETRNYVLEQAKANINFIKESPSNVNQAKQINASLATIVAMERNAIMNSALERAIINDKKNLQGLPE